MNIDQINKDCLKIYYEYLTFSKKGSDITCKHF